MSTSEAIAWESDAEAWELAARGEHSTAALHADFLSFWHPVSTRTLAAILMWTHSGWGLTDPQQRPIVDFAAVNVLSTAVLQQVRALLARGDERPIPELAVETHLDTTERLLGGTPYYDKEIPAPKFCADCLWQHLKSLASAAVQVEALQWFAGSQREVRCTDHLQALNTVLNRLKATAPRHQDTDWELTSLEVGSKLLDYSLLAVPGTVGQLIPSLMVTGFIGAALISPPPEPGMVLRPRPIQERRVDVPFAAPVTNVSAPPATRKPEPSTQQKKPPRRDPPTAHPPAAPQPRRQEPKAGGQRVPPKPAPTQVLPAGLIIDRPHKNGDVRPVSGPGLPRNFRKPVTSGPRKPDANSPESQPPRPPARGSGDEAPGSIAVVYQLAHELSIRLQRLGGTCTVNGSVFSVPPKKKTGLLIDGNRPRIEDIPLMKLALQECKK